MNQLIDIAKRSIKTLWVNKYLWFFGFFVMAASSGGGSGGRKDGGGGSPPVALEAIPSWVWGLMAVGVLVGIAFFVLHILSEAALIEGVADGEKGERLGVRDGLRRSKRHFWRVVGLKVLFGLVAGVIAGLIAAPLLLTHFSLIPLWAGVTLVVLLALVGLPLMLTLYFAYEYGLRFAVLEDRRTLDSLAHARRFLHGRLGLSIKLALLALVGSWGGWAVMMVVLVPAMILAGIGYLIGGVVPAAVVGGIVGLPIMALVLGAMGTFRSSVWTLGFLDQHYAPPITAATVA